MKSPLGKKIRAIAIGALATASLSVPVVSALGVTAHDAGKTPAAKPASHRLALGFTANSVRLT